jgi:hypothetical protein
MAFESSFMVTSASLKDDLSPVVDKWHGSQTRQELKARAEAVQTHRERASLALGMTGASLG